MIKVKQKGDFKRTEKYLKKHSNDSNAMAIMEKYGAKGVELLSKATPKRTGKTANSWKYELEASKGEYTISFINTNENRGVNIAIILQYGHGTRLGGYVRGRDYINPAVKQAFNEMRDEIVKEVKQI